MKKKLENYDKYYSFPKLYLNHLIEIENIIKGLGESGFKIEIENIEGSFIYDSFNEIKTENFKKIKITAVFVNSYNRLYINLSSGSGYLSYNNMKDDLSQFGAVMKIDQILNKNKINQFYVFFIKFILILLIIFTSSYFFVKNDIDIYPIFLQTFIIVYVLIYLSLNKIYLLNRSFVNFINKSDKRSFVSKNRDKLILTALGAVLGAILTHIF